MPWGARPGEWIVDRVLSAARLAIARGADVVVVPCNTASVTALVPLRAELEPGRPVVGTVPAVKPAADGRRPVRHLGHRAHQRQRLPGRPRRALRDARPGHHGAVPRTGRRGRGRRARAPSRPPSASAPPAPRPTRTGSCSAARTTRWSPTPSRPRCPGSGSTTARAPWPARPCVVSGSTPPRTRIPRASRSCSPATRATCRPTRPRLPDRGRARRVGTRRRRPAPAPGARRRPGRGGPRPPAVTSCVRLRLPGAVWAATDPRLRSLDGVMSRPRAPRALAATVLAVAALLLGACSIGNSGGSGSGASSGPTGDGVLWRSGTDAATVLDTYRRTPWNTDDADDPKAVRSPDVPGRTAVAYTVPGGGTRSELEPAYKSFREGDRDLVRAGALPPGRVPRGHRRTGRSWPSGRTPGTAARRCRCRSTAGASCSRAARRSASTGSGHRAGDDGGANRPGHAGALLVRSRRGRGRRR